jgi:hypothetical protein
MKSALISVSSIRHLIQEEVRRIEGVSDRGRRP